MTSQWPLLHSSIQYIPRNMHTVFALLCFVVVIHWLIFPYPSGLLHWHCGNLTIAPVPAKQPWWIWINTSCKFFMNDCITTTKQSKTKPCAYFLGYTVHHWWMGLFLFWPYRLPSSNMWCNPKSQGQNLAIIVIVDIYTWISTSSIDYKNDTSSQLSLVYLKFYLLIGWPELYLIHDNETPRNSKEQIWYWWYDWC